MTESVDSGLSALCELGNVEELRELAASGYAPASRPKLNSHIHLPPNFSAFENVAQAVSLADEQNIRVLCASNYYDFGVYGPFVAEARKRGIFPLFGTEIISRIDELVHDGIRVNDPGNPGRMYICGKGITAFSPLSKRARELLGYIRSSDESRMTEMVERLEDIFYGYEVQHKDFERADRELVAKVKNKFGLI